MTPETLSECAACISGLATLRGHLLEQRAQHVQRHRSVKTLNRKISAITLQMLKDGAVLPAARIAA